MKHKDDIKDQLMGESNEKAQKTAEPAISPGVRAKREGMPRIEQMEAYIEKMKASNLDQAQTLEEFAALEEELRRQNEELLQAHTALEIERKRYLTLFEFAPDGYLVTDYNGTIKEINHTAVEMFGKATDWLIGRPLVSCIAREDRDAFREMFDTLRRSKGKLVWEQRIRVNDSPAFHAEISVSPEPAFEGKGISFLWLIRDISERKRMESELQESVVRLDTLNKELQQFASIASHDLEEPLRKIRMFADMVEKEYGESLVGRARDYFSRIQKGAERMSALLEGLLHYSRVTTRARPFSPSDLTRIAQEVVSDLDFFIERKHGNVEIEDLPTAEVDEAQVRQLFQNLISNALKFNDGEHPHVRIYGDSSSDGECRIMIEDNGIGFDERYLDRIFQPFQRLHGRGSSYPGTGMGLAICKKIVERHGGSITARSKPGDGATFIVTLPLKQEG